MTLLDRYLAAGGRFLLFYDFSEGGPSRIRAAYSLPEHACAYEGVGLSRMGLRVNSQYQWPRVIRLGVRVDADYAEHLQARLQEALTAMQKRGMRA